MTRHFSIFLSLLVVFLLVSQRAPAQNTGTISAAVSGKKPLPGYFPLYWDEDAGRLLLLVNRWDEDFLYVNSMPFGVGSNDLGLDRGQLGRERVVRFERIGPKVLLVERNLSFRADTTDAAERGAVEQSFPQAVLWGFKAEAVSHGEALIDITDFALRDAHGIIQKLKTMNEGNFRVDPLRSAIFLERTKNFPRNTEIESIITYTTEGGMGRRLSEVSPSNTEFTVHLHHSFVALPEPGYKTRRFDPRSGYGDVLYVDYAAPLGKNMETRLLPRHRLQKKDPSAKLSDPIEPIVYYVDRGAPEPIRSALIEGASWWNQAFEAAGYRNAFRVDVMPEDADPMDVRYNVIQWVHRSSRGWSYGSSVIDPRTGEILKGHVTLGSRRVRQDYLIATGLLAPYETGKPVSPQMREMALARLRQLSAHEVGHTLGLAHNFAASMNNNASVMDYPHPLITIDANGALDLSRAYSTGIGEWDKMTIAYGYQDFPTGTDENAALDAILASAESKGLRYMTDRDSRPAGSASPDGHLWDNGPDPAAELARLIKVRQTALNHFSENVLQPGEPLSSMGETLVPIYLLHRYQAEAAAKVVGGLDYRYAVRSSAQTAAPPTRLVPKERQQAALTALLTTLSPEFLRIPERILEKIPPHPPGYARSAESFPSHTGLTFDPLAAAEVAADHVISLLLNPERAARLAQYSMRDSSQLGFHDVLAQLLNSTVYASHRAGVEGAIQRTVSSVVLFRLAQLSQSRNTSDDVKAAASASLNDIKGKLETMSSADPAWTDYSSWAASRIGRYFTDPKEIPFPKPEAAPPGQPIGSGEDVCPGLWQ